MLVELKRPFPSINQMDAFSLPIFAVLIGRNGVGKTQLLKAIARGLVSVSDISPSDIEEYDINSFQSKDSGKGGWGHSHFFQITTGRFFPIRLAFL